MENQLNEAIIFFKSEQVYGKLFKLFRKKYESLGRIGGTVPVKNFTKQELEEVGKFFGLPGEELKAKGIISLHAFEQQMEYTRFSSIPLKRLLDAYFGETIISKKEQQLQREGSLRSFLLDQKKEYPNIAFWIDFLLERRKEGRWIVQLAEREPSRFELLVKTLDRAFFSLPQQAERLPLFSQRITGDPHAFDLQTDLGKMFIHLLSVHRAHLENESMTEVPDSTEEINALFEKYHIFRDDLLNFVTCANLMAETSGGIHPVWEAAVQQQTAQIVPLRELIPIVCVYPMVGKTIWVVENSGVCATLLDHEPAAPIVCTNGHFTLATLMLLDLLVQNGCILYYAGDLDPEGLGMAQRLLDRYHESLRLWHMDTAGYQKSKPVKKLSQERIEKLKGITDERLLEVAEKMKKIGKAGYQEALVEDMLEDIKIFAMRQPPSN